MLVLGVGMVPQFVTAGTNTWTLGSGMYGGKIYALVSDGSSIYAGTEYGVYKSTDNGGSWALVNSGMGTQRVQTLAIEGTDIFAGTKSDGVFKSTNAGSSWTAFNAGLSPIPEVISLATDGTGSTGNIYAATNVGIFKSAVNTAGWVNKNSNGALSLVVDPDDSLHIYAGFRNFKGVYESPDGGDTWNQVLSSKFAVYSLVIYDAEIYAGANDGVYSKGKSDPGNLTLLLDIPKDIYALAVNSEGIYSGTFDGVYLDTLEKWETTSKITSLLIDGTTIYAGTDGIGVFKKTGTEIYDWTRSSLGLPPLAVNDVTPSNSALYAGTKSGVYKSTDQGVTWSELCCVCSQYKEVFSVAVSPDGNTIYAGTSRGRVYKSSDGGCNWEKKIITGSYEDDVWTLVMSNGDLYVGLSNGDIYKSTDGGDNWGDPISCALSDCPESIHELAVKTNDANILYVADDNGVFKITGGGTGMEDKTPENTYFSSLALDSSSPDDVYVGAKGPVEGIFQSNNAGDVWNLLDDSLKVESLVYDPTSSTLFVGTKTDGVYKSGGSYDPFNNGLPSPIRINSLVSDLTDSDIIHAGTHRGPYVFTIELECRENADCNDGLFCNGVEFCTGGVCQSGTNPCGSGQSCNESQHCYTLPKPGEKCYKDADCDDENPCTDDLCSDGSCTYSNNDTATCDDGLFCTVEDSCVGGKCVGTDRECDDDGLFCTAEKCDDDIDECVSSDGDPCDEREVCSEDLDVCLPPAGPCDISITPEDAALVSEQSLTFTAEVTGDCLVDTVYEWSVDSDIESNIDQNGYYVAGINTDCSELVTDVIRVTDTANGTSVEANVTVSCDRIKRVINLSNPLWLINPTDIYTVQGFAAPHILLILAEQGEFNCSASLTFEPTENITTLCNIGLRNAMLALVLVEANAQEGPYRATVVTDGHMVTKKEALNMSLPPWMSDE